MVGGILSDGSIPLFAAVPDLEEHPHRSASAIAIISDQRPDVILKPDEPRQTGQGSYIDLRSHWSSSAWTLFKIS
jgi:hypothetical protein